MSNDPLGHKLFDKRLEELPSIISEMLAAPIDASDLQYSEHCVIAGIGSSEAHARFLAHLINFYTKSKAEYMPCSFFYNQKSDRFKKSTLIIFSQGPSANAKIIIAAGKQFERTFLFTSNQEFQSEFVDRLIFFPQSNEYEILVRCKGPLTGFLAALQFVRSHWQTNLPVCADEQLLSVFKKQDPPKGLIDALNEGVTLLTSFPLSLYASNLVNKFKETLFISVCEVYDVFTFAHGPFQELIENPRPVISIGLPQEETLRGALGKLLQKVDAPHWVIDSPLPSPWSIFDYEMRVNYLLSLAIKEFRINMRDWPGVGLDKPMYDIDSPAG